MMTLSTNDGEKEQEYCAGLGTCNFQTGEVLRAVFVGACGWLAAFFLKHSIPWWSLLYPLSFLRRSVPSFSVLGLCPPLLIPTKPRQTHSPYHVFPGLRTSLWYEWWLLPCPTMSSSSSVSLSFAPRPHLPSGTPSPPHPFPFFGRTPTPTPLIHNSVPATRTTSTTRSMARAGSTWSGTRIGQGDRREHPPAATACCTVLAQQESTKSPSIRTVSFSMLMVYEVGGGAGSKSGVPPEQQPFREMRTKKCVGCRRENAQHPCEPTTQQRLALILANLSDV